MLWYKGLSHCFHIEVPSKVLGTSFLVLLSASVPGKEAKDGPSTWVFIHVGDQNEIPGFDLAQLQLSQPFME